MTRIPTRTRGLIAGSVLALVLAAGLAIVLGVRDRTDPVEVPKTAVPAPPGVDEGAGAEPFEDPYVYDPDRREEFERRAAAGSSHGLYALSPGGAAASAARTARWRPRVVQAAQDAGVDPDTLEALVFLESAGRADAIAGGRDLEGAVGLTQILAETGQNLLGMRVDVRASRRLTRRITRAERRGDAVAADRLRARRRRIDERFDPSRALAATARYLRLAQRTFGREELAFVSYHMGMGNLEQVLRAYAGAGGGAIADVVDDRALTYAQVYFDSSPVRHARAYSRLSRLGDDSSNYLWKLQGAREVMRLWRDEPSRLNRLATLQTAKNSAEEVLHPVGSTRRFGDPGALREAWKAGEIMAFPNDPRRLALSSDPRMGELAGRVGQERSTYRGLRPEALAVALYVGAQARAMAGRGALTVSSTVRDAAYQRQLVHRNDQATRNYSLHTTGWTFDVLRSYGSGRQARAFQFMLDRLRALNVIAWVREPEVIHITVSSDAKALLPLLRRIPVQRGG